MFSYPNYSAKQTQKEEEKKKKSIHLETPGMTEKRNRMEKIQKRRQAKTTVVGRRRKERERGGGPICERCLGNATAVIVSSTKTKDRVA